MTLIDNRNTADSYINLAIEEYLIRHADCSEEDYLLLYINEPCIVLGKNQSIYKEVNFEFLRNGQLKLCRRISGGGTVYQDKGNLCFSFISKFSEAKINNYRHFNQPMVDALRKIGVNAEMDERNNILCNGKKISGNAQFTNRTNMISHGTLLFYADLDVLRACLKGNEFTVESKAVSSVRSSVMNINEVIGKISSAEDLKAYLIKELKAEKVHRFTDDEWGAIHKSAEDKFKSFEWVYGRSPLTKITKGETEIDVEDGIIKQVRSKSSEARSLIGVRYGYKEIKEALRDFSGAAELVKEVF